MWRRLGLSLKRRRRYRRLWRHSTDLGLQAIVAGQPGLGFGDLAADLDVACQRVQKVVARAAARLGLGGAGERDRSDAEKK